MSATELTVYTAGDNKSAVFTGHVIGTTAIHLTSTGLISADSGMFTIVAPPSGGSGGGGGGGPIGPTTVTGVTNVTSAVNAQGVFNQDVNLWSDDNNVLLHIPTGTTVLTSSGTSVTQISLIHMATPLAFQVGAGMVTLAYDFTLTGTTFSPMAIVRFSYNPTLIPAGVAETSLQIAYYDSNVSSWITLTSTVDADNHFIYAQITHFTPYAVTYGVKALVAAPMTTSTTEAIPVPTVTTAVATTTSITTTEVITTTTAQAISTPLIVSTTTVTIPTTTTVMSPTPTSSATTTGIKTTAPIHSWWLWTIVVGGLVAILGIIILVQRRRT